MDQRLQAFAADIAQLDDATSVWSAMSAFAEKCGFPFCTLSMARRSSGIRSSRFITSLPSEFQDNYCDNGLISDDPFLSLICTNMAAAAIATDPNRFPGINHQQGEFLELTRSLGVKSAICIPVSTNTQPEFGGWIIGGTDDGTKFKRQFSESGVELQMAGLFSNERIRALTYRKNTSNVPLSPRERECLLWLSAGFRVTMIAYKLGISESAVTLYIQKARQKLGAQTREQAVVRAIQYGEIQL
ncbi:autoinducer binding domain-containing protein [uncultured Roseibium sp.]|uniref:helix-turn-helix transcriptional regulator n=1 Tax=uncultured Roseibium sp. TaxID=1936171 RepID=UPI0026213A74|nr:autoinducer binding domain-containing protein [uncultured Roseibium sp.]